MNKCAVSCCPKEATATVYCQMHYRRKRLYGDPQILLKKQRSVNEASKITILGDIAHVELSQGKIAVIDCSDVDLVHKFNWYWSSSTGYAYSYKAKTSLQQFLMGRAKYGYHLDHKDRDKLNCRRNNLHFATYSENRRNSDLWESQKGIAYHLLSQKYQAYINFEKTQAYLGVFNTQTEALAARQKAISMQPNYKTAAEFKSAWKLMRHIAKEEDLKRDE